jgi:peptidoglycan/xylan/chitin deacetylase (PgdA/CDA1 family)
MGLYSILGDLPSGDPDPNFTKKILVRYVLKEAQNGSIVVMHINKGGHHTAEALPDIIRGLRKKGFTLVKVSTLLGLPAYHKYPHRHKRADDAKD